METRTHTQKTFGFHSLNIIITENEDQNAIFLTSPSILIDSVNESAIGNEHQCTKEPLVSKSKKRSTLAITSVIFPPKKFRPPPTAPPKKGQKNHRREIQSTLLKHIPLKEKITTIEASRHVRKVKKSAFSKGQKN